VDKMKEFDDFTYDISSSAIQLY